MKKHTFRNQHFKSTFFLLSFFICCYYSSYAQTITAGGRHSLSICTDGTVQAWGWNNYGQLGNGLTVNDSFPTSISGLTDVVAISGGLYNSFALKSNGQVSGWGYNSEGEVGNGTTGFPVMTPVQVSGLTNVVALASGRLHTLALKSDGTVWAWGIDNLGQLGDGTTGSVSCGCRKSPVQVSGLTNVIAIAAGGDGGGQGHSLALKSDGTVWAWGYNSDGQVGDSSNTNRLTPVQVLHLTGIVSIAAGGYHSLAVKSDGTLWAWGYNNSGQLGDGTGISRTTPVQVSGLTNTLAVSAGDSHSLALKSNGTVWSWGYNGNGQLGDGTYTTTYSPALIPGLTGVSAIAAGQFHSLALKSSGTLWACGYNIYGQLGDGTTLIRTSLVQTVGLCPLKTCSANFILYTDVTPHNWIALNQATGVQPISYLWRWGDGDSSTGITPSHTYSSPGYYNICLSIIDGNGCRDTSCDSSIYLNRPTSSSTMVQVNVITAAPTGINDATITTNSIRCYPNPVTGILTVETGDEKRLEKIIIYSIEGKKVDEEIIQGKTQKINIPLNTLSNGVYILDCVFEKSSQKIMILKQ